MNHPEHADLNIFWLAIGVAGLLLIAGCIVMLGLAVVYAASRGAL